MASHENTTRFTSFSRKRRVNTSAPALSVFDKRVGSMEDAIHKPQPSILANGIYEALQSDKASKYSDVSLVSSDEVVFPSVRALLVISSPFFDSLLTSDFAEKSLQTVPISVKSSLLREVLEFIYIDDCQLVRNARTKTRLSEPVSCATIRNLVNLANVADYLQLERLLSVSKETVETMCAMFPHLCCVVLDTLHRIRGEWSSSLYHTAKEIIRTVPKRSLLCKYDNCPLQCGVLHFSEYSLEPTITHLINYNSDDQVQDIFQALIVWASCGTALRSSPVLLPGWEYEIFIDTTKMQNIEERLCPASTFATFFKLSDFKPQFLSHVVEKSGLCRLADIIEAYKQLLFGEEGIESAWE